MSITDLEIIERSLTEPAVFAELYDRHARTIHRYVARRLGTEAADDLMSETFLVAFSRRDIYKDRVNALPWLYGITSTLMKSHRRAEARAWRGLIAEERARVVADEIADSDTRMDALRAHTRVSKALRRLTVGERDVLLLSAWADLDYEGIASALDIPVGTVRSRLSRARHKVRAHIDSGVRPQKEDDDERDTVPAPHEI